MTIKTVASALLAPLLIAMTATGSLAQPPAYTFVDLGSLGGDYTYPYAVNDAGQVAVYSRTTSGQYHAALYSNGTLTDLTPTAFQSFPEWQVSLNAAGHVYGRAQLTSGSCYTAFLYYQGSARMLSTGGCDSYVVKMNASGQVVGYGQNGSGQQVAFVYTPNGATGTFTTIWLGGTYSYAHDINDAGIAVGYAQLANGTYHAFRHDTATGVTTDLGTLGGSHSYARSINASGQIAGWSYNSSGYQRAVRWTASGAIQDMGSLGGSWSYADKLDASGRVYGQAQTSGGTYRSFRSDGVSAIAIDPTGSTGGYPSYVSATGFAAGYYHAASGYYQPYVFNGTSAFGLASVYYGFPQDLSQSGFAVGYYYPTSLSSYVAFLFSPAANTFYSLSTSSLLQSVNESGWAVGWANLPTLGQRALLSNGTSTYNIHDIVVEPAGAQLYDARHIADTGYIAGYGYWSSANRAYLLVPGTLDTEPPVSTASAEPLPNAAGWANADVTVTITAEDETDGSGLKEIVYSAIGAGALAQTVIAGNTATFVVSAEGETTITYFARDDDDNEEAPKTLVVRIDKTAPAFTCGSADGVWHGANVSIGCTAGDPVSGLVNASDAAFDLTTSVAAEAESADAATDSRTVCDLAGNCVTAGPVGANKIDRRRPDVTVSAPAAGTYVFQQVVSAGFACGDTGAGVASCTGDVVTGAPIDTATAGAKSFAVTAVDAVGNTRTTTVSYTVLKGIPAISWDPPASITYGAALGSTELDATSSVPGSFLYTPAAGTVLAVGTHPLSATFTPDDAANYESVTTANSIAVSAAVLTVTAADATKVYGAAVPSLTAAIDGFVNGDTIASLAGTLAVGTTATSASPVGGYPITPSGLSSPNYTVTFVPATLTVTPAALTITAAPASKVYGAPLPAFAAIFGGFVNGDDESDLTGSLTFSTAATAASGVASYPVTPGGLSSPNYTIGFVDGSLAVTPAPLAITADDKSMVLNGSVPALTASYNGLVNGDTPASLDVPVSLATAATGTTPGSFPITAANAADANYTISFTPGTLSVAFAPAGACLAGPGRTILEPINVAGTSVFKRNATVPAKFRICDAAGVAVATAGTITDFRLIQTQAGTVSAVNEPVESTTPFNEFRWDTTGQHWIFNMDTKGLSANTTYVFRVSLADGTWLDFRFGLR